MPKLLIKRGTRAQLNAAASGSALNAGEPYLITDEGRLAVGTAAGTYETVAKEVHGHSTADVSGLGTIATQAASNVSITGGAISGVTLSASSVTADIGSVAATIATTADLAGHQVTLKSFSSDINHKLGIVAQFAVAPYVIPAGIVFGRRGTLWGTYAAIHTSNDGVDSDSFIERLRVTPTGSVLIGTATSTGPKLEVNGSAQATSLQVPATARTLANGLNSNITGAGFLRVSGPTGAFSLGGFTLGADGRELKVYNTTAQAMTIVNEDASSTAANRITTLTGADVVLRTGTSFATFVYDSTASRWILTSYN